MRESLGAVAFDLDGTLYPNYRFYRRLVSFAFKETRLLLAFSKARAKLHAAADTCQNAGDFYELQAEIMAKFLKEEPARVREKTEERIYRGWEPLFRTIKLFARVKECLTALRDAGLKLGLLSDFPPKRKLNYLGLDGFFDAVLCSEDSGMLKPAPAPFLELAKALDQAPSRILYVGNSVSYDILGARGAGMKTALIRAPWQSRRGKAGADLVFSDYRTLRNFVLS
ncbi:MAG: HAD family hydrolase [Spirochaetaceae bacterium]|jgi:putative hydrolase of the HAD superfamily|nr:HAD family hydrolase [Spirochaetaceae bacterium]